MPPRAGSEVGCRRIPVARGKDMRASPDSDGLLRGKSSYGRAVSRPAWTWSLKALFAATLTAGEILHLLFVQLDLARLLHLLTQIDQKHPEQFLLLGAQQ